MLRIEDGSPKVSYSNPKTSAIFLIANKPGFDSNVAFSSPSAVLAVFVFSVLYPFAKTHMTFPYLLVTKLLYFVTVFVPH